MKCSTKGDAMAIKLQLAIDLADAEMALRMADQVQDVVDIIEVGTPLILREGMRAVRLIKARYPQAVVLADTKIVDGGAIEAGDAFDAGADIVTALAVADDATLQAVVEAAHQRGKQVMADMIVVADVASRAVALEAMGVDLVCLHTGVDVQKSGKTPLAELAQVMAVLAHAKAAVAGGITLASLPAVKALGPEVVVAGSALTRAPDLRAAALAMQAVLRA